ncbi:MAG: tRNA (N6-isopentenyl adenosine(37)-C2)-methylthiotransferase MiaB [candidate division Zixibacteria bacterium]
MQKTYYLHSYGCQMNLADSGILSAAMDDAGFVSVSNPEEAGVIIINTCSVREKAEERALGRLTELARIKKTGDSRICAVGCMAQRMGEKILERIPKIDFILGTERLFDLPRLLNKESIEPVVDTRMTKNLDWAEFSPAPDNSYSAHVTISRGCDNYCAYCIVPYLRGPERHREPGAIIDDINDLYGRGIVEITLVGQNVNSYNSAHLKFPGLLKKVVAETDINRIRFITSHPKDLSDDLIDLFSSEPKLMGHFHLPLQSGSDRILEMMFRKYDYTRYLSLIHQLRQARPNIAITTDLIVGFPTETEDEFGMTLEAVRDIRFDAAFMFRYSVRDGTWAAKNLKNDVPEEVKLRRLQELIELQKEISYQVNQKEIGRISSVLIDGTSRRDASVWKGKTEGNKTILLKSPEDLLGKVVNSRINRADSWTLHGELAA